MHGNNSWSGDIVLFSVWNSTSAKFTFSCALMSCGSRSGEDEYTFAFFDWMGSIDLLNSSSSIIMLVSSFSFSRPMLFSQTEPAESWWRCALRTAPHWAPPLPARNAAQRGTEETQQSHFPGPFHWWLTPLCSKLASSKEPRTPEASGADATAIKTSSQACLICTPHSSLHSSSNTDKVFMCWN